VRAMNELYQLVFLCVGVTSATVALMGWHP
jgi:hypothetical protein